MRLILPHAGCVVVKASSTLLSAEASGSLCCSGVWISDAGGKVQAGREGLPASPCICSCAVRARLLHRKVGISGQGTKLGRAVP